MKTCPLCEKPMHKAMYCGAPGHICSDEECSCLTGPACTLASSYFNGAIVTYTGSYWAALWGFLRGDFTEQL